MLREIFEEPGIGPGPGKIGKDLITHVNPVDIGSNCCASASVVFLILILLKDCVSVSAH